MDILACENNQKKNISLNYPNAVLNYACYCNLYHATAMTTTIAECTKHHSSNNEQLL